MDKVTYIIPIHSYNKETAKYFKRAISSIAALENSEHDKVMLVGPSNVIEKAKLDYNIPNELILTVNEGKTDFFSQINAAAFNCVTPYFSILEFDDVYKPYWNTVAQEYGSNGASVLIPIQEIYNEKGEAVGIVNAMAWSPSFANSKNEETENGSGNGLGYIDIDCLDTFSDFFLTGSLFKTEDFLSVGGLKPSFGAVAWLEFLYRMAYHGKLIYVVPRIAYEHIVGRKDSFHEEVSTTVTAEAFETLTKLAKQEYFFKEERNIKVFDEPEEIN